MKQFLDDISSKPKEVIFNFQAGYNKDILVSHSNIDKVIEEIKKGKEYACQITVCDNKYILAEFWVDKDTLSTNNVKEGYKAILKALENPYMYLWFISDNYFMPGLHEFSLTKYLIKYVSGDRSIFPIHSNNKDIKCYVGKKLYEFADDKQANNFLSAVKTENKAYAFNRMRGFLFDIEDASLAIKYNFRRKTVSDDIVIDFKEPYLTLYEKSEVLAEIKKIRADSYTSDYHVLLEMSVLNGKYIIGEAWVDDFNNFEEALADIEYYLANPNLGIWFAIRNKRLIYTPHIYLMREIVSYLCKLNKDRLLTWGEESIPVYVGSKDVLEDYNLFFSKQIENHKEIDKGRETAFKLPPFKRKHREIKGGH